MSMVPASQSRRWSWLGDLLGDMRHGLRLLKKSPGFAAVAILTLALGIGANTAIFSLVHAVLLNPLPFKDSGRLVRITFNRPNVGLREVLYSVPELNDLRSAGVFESVAAFVGATNNMDGSGRPVRVELLVVSPNYFSVLGVVPQLGRVFGPQDAVPGFADTVVISDSLWHGEFGSDPKIIGRKLWLDNDPYTIIAVLPPDFRHPSRGAIGNIDVFSATEFSGPPYPKPARGVRTVGKAAIGRLAPGVSFEQAQARLNNLAAGLRREYPGDYPARTGWSIEIRPLGEALVGDVQPLLLLLMGTMVLILLIAAVNVANLLLARASVRQHEIVVRLAVGASAWRIARQLLAEAVILALVAGIAGVTAAVVFLKVALQFLPSTLPRLNEVSVSWPVLAFAFLLSIATGVIFGLAPALQAARPDLIAAMRAGSRGSGSNSRHTFLRRLLIVAEMALSVVLIVGAGLLLRTLSTLLKENPGFNPSGVVVATFRLNNPNDPRMNRYPDAKSQVAFVREVLRRVSDIRGVDLAGMTTSLPMMSSQPPFPLAPRPEGGTEPAPGLNAEGLFVSPEYFRVMQATLLRGRFFDEKDDLGKPEVIIIDETTANRYWPGAEAVGRRLRPGAAPRWMTVVGIIRDIRHDGLDRDTIPHVYAPIYQSPFGDMSLVIRTRLTASSLGPAIQSAVDKIDPGLPIYNVRSMDTLVSDSLLSRKLAGGLVGAFAAIALILSSIGIYGLLDYMVRQRSREIAIRVALGGRPSDVRMLVFRHGAALAISGILAGLVIAGMTARLITSLLYGVAPFDPVIFLSVPVLLLAIACLATYIPARRATKVDPMTALRQA